MSKCLNPVAASPNRSDRFGLAAHEFAIVVTQGPMTQTAYLPQALSSSVT
ncbi:hypothetical protein [Stenomitos frigidus]